MLLTVVGHTEDPALLACAATPLSEHTTVIRQPVVSFSPLLQAAAHAIRGVVCSEATDPAH